MSRINTFSQCGCAEFEAAKQRTIELIDQITKNMKEHEIKDFYIQLKKTIEIVKQYKEENDAFIGCHQ